MFGAMSLSLKLLGDFTLRDGSGAALSLSTRKTRALLAYLAVNADRPQPRERLMALLWSDRGERQARQSLNQAAAEEASDAAAMERLDLEYQRDQLHLEVLLDIRELLTPEQPDQTTSLLEKAQQIRRLTKLRP